MKRVVTVTFHYAVARRIDCEHCGMPYTYVYGETKSASEEQSAAFADDEQLRQVALRKAANSVDSLAGREQIGRGRCANCRKLQDWMVVTPMAAAMSILFVGLAIGAVLAFGGWFVTSEFLDLSVPIQIAVSAGLAAATTLAAVAAAVIGGPRLADSTDAADSNDPLSMSDEELLAFIGTCDGIGPFLSWWARAGAPPKVREIPFDMGIKDLSTAPLVLGNALAYETRSAALNRL